MEHDRDPKFEIQYLLSLIVAVLGSLSSRSISQYVPEPTAYILLFLIFTHIVVFNLVYTLRRATEFELSEVNTLETGTHWTLYGITGLFSYLLTSVAFQWGRTTLSIRLTGRISTQLFGSISHRILFEYVAPMLVVLVMGGISWRKITPSIRQARDIEISVVPDEIHVFHTFDSTRPLHVNIENKSDSEISFTTIIELPEEIEWRYRETTTGEGTFTDDANIPPSGGHEPYNIELRYQGEERMTKEVDIVILMGDDTYRDSVVLTLEEY